MLQHLTSLHYTAFDESNQPRLHEESSPAIRNRCFPIENTCDPEEKSVYFSEKAKDGEKRMAPRIATVGDNCMDVYDNLGKACPGGNPVNVAVYIVRMGGTASYTGIVGTDEYGEMMVDAIAAKGVDVSHVRTEKGATALTHVELVNGERIMGDYEEGVMENFTLRPEDVDFLGSHEFVVSALWGNAQGYFGAIRARGAKIAYDAAVRPWDPAAQEALPNVDYLFYSVDGGDTPENRKRMIDLHAQGPSLVVATMGERGSLAYDGEKFIRGDIVPCDIVDTMGAGDSYIAGFVKGLAEGKEISECMKMGAECASVTIGYFGAW